MHFFIGLVFGFFIHIVISECLEWREPSNKFLLILFIFLNLFIVLKNDRILGFVNKFASYYRANDSLCLGFACGNLFLSLGLLFVIYREGWMIFHYSIV